MQLAVKVVVQDDQRSHDRAPIQLGSTVRLDNQALDAVVLDLSYGGCSLETAGELEMGQHIKVSLVGLPPLQATVQWREGNRYGCLFESPLAQIEWEALGRTNVHPWPVTQNEERSHVSVTPTAGGRRRLAVVAGAALLPWISIAAAWILLAA